MTQPFNGLGLGMGNLARLSRAKSRSISAENFTGAKGAGGMATEGTGAVAATHLGRGWKVSPSVRIEPGQTFTVAEIEGSGAIQQIWMTAFPGFWRSAILRMYWDGEATPSVETPLGDFFGAGWTERCRLSSLAVCVNPAGGFNCYWEMPFRRSARITLENRNENPMTLYYQVNYTLTDVPEDVAYFHAQWRRSNPLPYKEVHTLLDGVRGHGHYVGTYLAWGVHSNGWWGEGEIKFFMDGDGEWPTICGTGTEDYFGGAWDFEEPGAVYGVFSTPYSGLHEVQTPSSMFRTQQRFGMYRWHIMDPVRFEQDLRVTIQALGWRPDRVNLPAQFLTKVMLDRLEGGWRPAKHYLPLQDDIASTAFWYQTEPHAPFPALPGPEQLEVI
jgi:hypothetical protein